MKLDPKLLARLEATARETGRDVNTLLAEALGVCPTCGQPLNREPPAKQRRGLSRRDAILAWRVENPDATQAACARALSVSQAYVGRVWNEADKTVNGEGTSK